MKKMLFFLCVLTIGIHSSQGMNSVRTQSTRIPSVGTRHNVPRAPVKSSTAISHKSESDIKGRPSTERRPSRSSTIPQKKELSQTSKSTSVKSPYARSSVVDVSTGRQSTVYSMQPSSESSPKFDGEESLRIEMLPSSPSPFSSAVKNVPEQNYSSEIFADRLNDALDVNTAIELFSRNCTSLGLSSQQQTAMLAMFKVFGTKVNDLVDEKIRLATAEVSTAANQIKKEMEDKHRSELNKLREDLTRQNEDALLRMKEELQQKFTSNSNPSTANSFPVVNAGKVDSTFITKNQEKKSEDILKISGNENGVRWSYAGEVNEDNEKLGKGVFSITKGSATATFEGYFAGDGLNLNEELKISCGSGRPLPCKIPQSKSEKNSRIIECSVLYKTEKIQCSRTSTIRFFLDQESSTVLEFGKDFVFLGTVKVFPLYTREKGLYWDKDGNFYNGTFSGNNFVSGTIVDVEGNVTTK